MLITKSDYAKNVDQVADLFYRSFGKQISTDYLTWRYCNNPIDDFFVAVESDDTKLIGHYAVSPVQILTNGSICKAAISMTTMTDPDYAGMGIFPKLAHEVYDALRAEGYEFVCGFTNPNRISHGGLVHKLNWVDIYEIPTFRFDLTNISKQNDIFNTMDTVESDDSFSFLFCNSECHDDLHFIKKDNSYLKWRYKEHPTNNYKCLVIQEDGIAKSYYIYKLFSDSIDLVDFQAQSIDHAERLISKVIDIALNENLLAINVWAPRHHLMHGVLERKGFVNREPITYFSYLVFSPNCNFSNNYADWFIQMGDSDVY